LRRALWLLALCLPLHAEFRAAAVKIDITPKTSQWLLGYGARQSTGVHDNLYHRIIVMDDGSGPFVLVSTDIALFAPSFYDDFTRQLKQETGIEAQRVWWMATHTHSAPELGPAGLPRAFMGNRYTHEPDAAFAAQVTKALVDGIKEARGKLAPATVTVGTSISMANINRRARGGDGKIYLGLNPDGPVDRQLGIIRLERPDHSPIALIVNYAMHGTVLGPGNLEISGDWPGQVATYVEQKIGAPMLVANGAAGNIAPIYGIEPDFKSGHMAQFNVLLGDRILAAIQALGPPAADAAIWAGEKIIETPRKAGLTFPEELNAYSRLSMVRIPVRFLKLGSDTVIWAAPLELFCEIAMRVRGASPFPNTFYFGYTNGWLGYLPTKEAFSEGGYETTVTPYTEQAERDFGDGVIQFVQGMSRR
jgi:neutral ceramidase